MALNAWMRRQALVNDVGGDLSELERRAHNLLKLEMAKGANAHKKAWSQAALSELTVLRYEH